MDIWIYIWIVIIGDICRSKVPDKFNSIVEKKQLALQVLCARSMLPFYAPFHAPIKIQEFKFLCRHLFVLPYLT